VNTASGSNLGGHDLTDSVRTRPCFVRMCVIFLPELVEAASWWRERANGGRFGSVRNP